jgi:hypothetical protein
MSDHFDIEEGQEVVRNTIVGGRPRARRKRKIAIPIGLEKVLTRAAGDPAFRRRLFEDRRAALASLGWELQTSEAVILGAVPNDVLDTMIGRIDLKLHTKRRFMKGIATAVFATAAMTSGVTCVGCGDVATKGVRPDDAIEAQVSDSVDVEQSYADLGNSPEEVESDLPMAGVGVDVRPPEEIEVDAVPPADLGNSPETIDAEEVFPVGILDDGPEVIDVSDDQPAVGGILPDINEVEVDQGQNDGGARPDTDVEE